MENHEGCPYGASDCPKIETLRKMIERNNEELKIINDNVIQLTSTIKTISYIAGVFITVTTTILAALIGVCLL